MKKLFYSNCKIVLSWLTLPLLGVITTAKKPQYNVFSAVKERPKTKKITERTKYSCLPCPLYRGRFQAAPEVPCGQPLKDILCR